MLNIRHCAVVCAFMQLAFGLLSTAACILHVTKCMYLLIASTQVESQLGKREVNGRQGLLSHQGASLARGQPHFPWLPFPWPRLPWRVGLRPQKRTKAFRSRETITFTRWGVQKETAQAGSNWCVFNVSNMPAFVYFFNLNKSQTLNGKSDLCTSPALALQL